MLVIENYKKMVGLKFGEWNCGIAEEYDPYYRFSFREGDIPNLGWKRTFWIEVSRTSHIDSDGDKVYKVSYPNMRHETIVSKEYLKSFDKVRVFFLSLLRDNAG